MKPVCYVVKYDKFERGYKWGVLFYRSRDAFEVQWDNDVYELRRDCVVKLLDFEDEIPIAVTEQSLVNILDEIGLNIDVSLIYGRG